MRKYEVCILPYHVQHQNILINPEHLESNIKEHHVMLIVNSNDQPVTLAQQLKAWQHADMTSYKQNREVNSTRNTPWSDLTNKFAAYLMKTIHIPHRQITKTIFDKYANGQYSTQICPLCRQGPDNREHLYFCTEAGACLIRMQGQTMLNQLPTERQLAENTSVSTQQAAHIRSTLLDLV